MNRRGTALIVGFLIASTEVWLNKKKPQTNFCDDPK